MRVIGLTIFIVGVVLEKGRCNIRPIVVPSLHHITVVNTVVLAF